MSGGSTRIMRINPQLRQCRIAAEVCHLAGEPGSQPGVGRVFGDEQTMRTFELCKHVVLHVQDLHCRRRLNN